MNTNSMNTYIKNKSGTNISSKTKNTNTKNDEQNYDKNIGN